MAGLIGRRGEGVCYDKDRSPFWSSHGTEVPQDATPEDICHLVTPWEAEAVPCMNVEGTPIKTQSIIRSDTRGVIGEVGPDYRVLTNEYMWDTLTRMAKGSGLEVETAGTLFGGSRVWLMCNAGSLDVTGHDDWVNLNFFLGNSHDGSTTFGGGPISHRILCENTFARAMAKSLLSVRHTVNAEVYVEAALQEIGLQLQAEKERIATYSRMTEVNPTAEEVDAVLAKLFPEREDAKRDTWTKPREEVSTLFESSPAIVGHPGVEGTVWGLMNAVSEYNEWVHRSDSLAAERRFVSAISGPIMERNEEAYQTLVAMT